MVKLKLSLLIPIIILVSIIAESKAAALTIDEAIAQARAQTEAAIAQAQAQALNQIEMTIAQAQTQIKEALDEAAAQVEEALIANSSLNVDTINNTLATIQQAINEAITQIEEAINENSSLSEEMSNYTFAKIKEKIDKALALITETTVQEPANEDIDTIAELIQRDIRRLTVTIANRLDQTQIKAGVYKGTWPDQAEWTGSIVAGLACAYEVTGDITFKTSAELGGNYIICTANGNFCGDEAFALSRLSQISDCPFNNQWREALSNFYRNIKNNVDGTQGYISQFATSEPSAAVFHLANHVVAAYYANAEDKDIWRKSLIIYLARIDDSCSDYPVMTLGIATWALANTGPLDNTLIDPSGQGAFYWREKKLSDLPGLVYSHQVHDCESYEGCFYRRLDHGNSETENPINGYTEDTIFDSLGLISASRANPLLHLDSAILAAFKALLEGINNEGKVFELLWTHNCDCYTFSGEMLQVLAEYAINDCSLVTIETGGL